MIKPLRDLLENIIIKENYPLCKWKSKIYKNANEVRMVYEEWQYKKLI
jgi:hypothetical protein